MRFFVATSVMAASAVMFGPTSTAVDRGPSFQKDAKRAATKIRLPASSLADAPEPYKTKPVQANRRDEALVAAGAIDSAVRSKILEVGERPNRRCDDETFLRRVYLDVAGRIPTLAEVEAFLDSDNPDKRIDLIDQLLSSSDYVSNMYNMWADTLRLVDKPENNRIATPYMSYVRDTIAENKPYDKWVYEMLTANGKVWENPATGFQLRDEGMPLPYVDNTVRVFLGTQIGCAQCHDHPFDSWTQYEFYQLAALTAGTTTKHIGLPMTAASGKSGAMMGGDMMGGDMMGGDMMSDAMESKADKKPAGKKARGKKNNRRQNPANELMKQARTSFPKGRVPGEFRVLVGANDASVGETKRRLRLPKDYAYGDAKPSSFVQPAVLWGDLPEASRSMTGREQFATWVTSHENDRFAQTIANRLWKRFIGVGVVEPIDDFRDDNDPFNEYLLETLADQMRGVDFDLKQFIRGILYSDTYQAVASQYEITSGEPYYFAGPVLRRMTAEQVWDSMLTLAVRNSTPFTRPDAEDFKKVTDIDLNKATFEQVVQKSKQFSQTLRGNAYSKEIRKHAYLGNVLCRASELPAPLPGDHFLRQFGQSDREVIDGSDQSATVPQILAMFNGPITHVMLEPGSRIVDDILAIPKSRERIDGIFRAVLARSPTPADRRVVALELSRSRSDSVSFGNIIWALLNTREFLFVR